MWLLCKADLADFVGERQVNFHSFADDSQTYVHCLPIDVDKVVCQLEGYISEVGHWMSPNRLKGELNPKIKLDLNDSFFTLINKYNPHIF